ncbi:hypothetical protein [Nocardioides sp. BYT-33-1]|uniref:hypothetical protein n=1 Tax=Nocardioides sp. BYT-33-1 TaxID=3416952 RepID=UPI003F52E60F
MEHRRLAASILAITLATGAFAGCGGRDERAITVDGDKSSDAKAEKPEAQEEQEEPAAAAGRELTQAQAKAALLAVTDMPSGWTLGEEDDGEDDSDDEVTPARCDKVMEALDDDSSEPSVEEEINLNKGGAFGTFLSETISSFPEEIDEDRLQQVADALSDCSSFSTVDEDGVKSDFKVAPLSMANLGDASLAIAMTVDSEGFSATMNVVMIQIGHNGITLLNGGLAGADGADLETFGKQAIQKLEQAVQQ